MKYFSMFSGIGGFELGIDKAFLGEAAVQPERQMDVLQPTGHITDSDSIVGSRRGTRPICVGYSEIDKYAIKVYERNFSGHKNYGDATKINPTELPDFDLLVGGFPCQAFSVAGKRMGFDDTRGTLFFDIARILAVKRPRHLVLENVKGLLSHDGGKTFQTILGVLADLGYCVEWQVLNSKDFGVPQNRERVYIVGHFGGECGRQVFPITGTNGKDIVQLNNPTHSNDRVYSASGVSPTLNTMQGGNRQPFVSYNRNDGIKGEIDVAHTLSSSDYRGLNRNQDQTAVYEHPRIRRLTPTECERLQGFPDRWTEFGAIRGTNETEIMSDTQRYKMCGNAVTVNVVEAVMRSLYSSCGEG